MGVFLRLIAAFLRLVLASPESVRQVTTHSATIGRLGVKFLHRWKVNRMADAAVSLRPELAQDALKVVINGKLIEQRRNDGLFYSTVITPAPDAYTQPMPFEIRSVRSLGERDQVITVPCRVGGYFRRSYDTKPDPRTGETRRVRPVVIALDAIEN